MFIDSSNFYHSLKAQNDLPFDAKQYAALIGELRNYFDITGISFYDAIKNRIKDPAGYAKQQRFHDCLRKELPNIRIVTRKLKYVKSISQEESAEAAKNVGLSSALKEKLYLFLKKLGVIRLTREKGLDVLIVVDALEAHKSKKAERLILLSGDSDYVPAVEFMQKDGAKIVNLHTYHGSAKELRDACYEHILIDIDVSGRIALARGKS